MTRLPAPALMLASVLSIQFGQAVGKQLAGVVGAPGAVALRLGLAALVLLLLHRPSLPRGRAETVSVLGLGTAIAGMNLIYPALLFLPLGLASALQLLGPVTSRCAPPAACATRASPRWPAAGCGSSTPRAMSACRSPECCSRWPRVPPWPGICC
ncbi:DMT family transporter [Streptomyces albus]|uniref:hypothetical protein n=1 Tax=Streptomyces sp. NRRL F-5917 TaxID=1463873 RepID=UPI001F339A32|nr:hypothetical protein [Streptomyces sp. NRRL F-5917]